MLALIAESHHIHESWRSRGRVPKLQVIAGVVGCSGLRWELQPSNSAVFLWIVAEVVEDGEHVLSAGLEVRAAHQVLRSLCCWDVLDELALRRGSVHRSE